MTLRVVAMAACAVLLGCDGVGRAVVGEHWLGGARKICETPLPCASIPLEPPSGVPEGVEPVDLQTCTHVSPAFCPSGAVTGVGSCPDPSVNLQVSVADAQSTGVLRELSCRSVRLAPDPDASSELHVALRAWTDVRMEVASSEPLTLELAGGKLDHVSLSLRGPITLRLVDVSGGGDVRVIADNGRAHVELLRASLSSVVLSVPEGELLLRRSWLQGVAAQADRIDVESAYVRDAAWKTASLSATDATLVRLRSEARRSVLAACNVEMTSFLACQSLSTIDGSLTDVQLSACADEAAIYGSDVQRAQIEGDLILDRAGIYDSVLGVGEVGAITTWDSQLTNISFCADQQAIAVGGMTGAECVHCDVAPEPTEPDACLLDKGFLRATKSSCPGLELPPECGDPQPNRMRPPLN